MPMNRVQFQRGLSMPEFMDRYGTDAQCEAALATARWPDGFACPNCNGPASSSFRREGRLYWQCARCRHQCSVISGTIFEATKLPLSRWFLAMHLLTQAKNNVSALELMPYFPQVGRRICAQFPGGKTEGLEGAGWDAKEREYLALQVGER